MSKQRVKGTSFETQVVEYLRLATGDDRVERRTCSGAKDRGDISGVYIRGRKVVLECKNRKRMELSQWLDEAETERGNDGAEFAFVVHKRNGCGEKNMHKTYVTCTLETLAALVVGARDLMFYDKDDRPGPQYRLRERGIDEFG